MWFHQEEQNGIFWLSVQAVYDTQDPIYKWGWTNHAHVYNDDAVQGYWDSGLLKWKELYDQTGVSEDMSFMLFTDPYECYTGPDYSEWVAVGKPTCWCNVRQCHGDADGIQHTEKGKVPFWVGVPDLQTLITGWKQDYSGDPSLDGPDPDALPDTWICADFDHIAHTQKGIPYAFRVGVPDLQILIFYWKAPNPPNITAPPTDCLTASPVSP
jgi:hypothetical protein